MIFNVLSSSDFTTNDIIILIVLVLILIILRGLLKCYITSKIMCALFSIATIVLSIIIMCDKADEKMGMLGPWVFYTTLSSLIYSFGPEVFDEEIEYQLTYHEGFFSSYFKFEPHRTGGILAYLAGCGIGTFIVVNLIGYQGNIAGVFLIIPCICLLISSICIIKYFS